MDVGRWIDVIDWSAWTGKVHAGALTWLVEHPVPSQVSLHEWMGVAVAEDEEGKKTTCFTLRSGNTPSPEGGYFVETDDVE